MRLIGLAVVLAVSLALAPLAVEAQETGKVYRIGYLALTPGEDTTWIEVAARPAPRAGLWRGQEHGFRVPIC